ncbi:uncharacterized protein BJ171DRAFT_105970 [Polychytrium aggregatum]|uniref:uncharacterized protein n=1 Tax=Polychytrium aggregatum TaxID=110093 RepID=UPI0022FE94B0|nr:uncharacterized protein BJ171DRAFT_105970 [Polychytrium aggregatum]KAI9204381.1 hypothetical protein BJ171DRAFT_105970 [Polychytrium aggregatum]
MCSWPASRQDLRGQMSLLPPMIRQAGFIQPNADPRAGFAFAGCSSAIAPILPLAAPSTDRTAMTKAGQLLARDSHRQQPGALFGAVCFRISSSVPPHQHRSLHETLAMHGAHPESSSGAVLTHVISLDAEEADSREQGVVVVTPAWVASSVQLKELASPAGFSADRSMIFSGFVVAADGMSDRDLSIFGGIEALGGQWRLSLEPDVTHLIAPSDETAVCKAATARGIPVILPHYFDDCIALKRRLLDDIYRFPSPKFFVLDDPAMLSRYAKVSAIGNEEADTVGDTSNFLREHVFFIEPRIWSTRNEKECAAITEFIDKHGGSVASEYGPEVTCVVVVNRESPFYLAGEEDGKMVGSWLWLKVIIKSKQIRSPRLRLLHYPPPPQLEGMRGLTISVTNYTGKARTDIEYLIAILGGRYTGHLTPTNTHLICARPTGSKYEKAVEWNIHVINHLWLEEACLHGVIPRESRMPFVRYPPLLSRCVGEVSVPLSVIKQAIGSLKTTSSSPETHPSLAAADCKIQIGESGRRAGDPSDTRSDPPRASAAPPRPQSAHKIERNTIAADAMPKKGPKADRDALPPHSKRLDSPGGASDDRDTDAIEMQHDPVKDTGSKPLIADGEHDGFDEARSNDDDSGTVHEEQHPDLRHKLPAGTKPAPELLHPVVEMPVGVELKTAKKRPRSAKPGSSEPRQPSTEPKSKRHRPDSPIDLDDEAPGEVESGKPARPNPKSSSRAAKPTTDRRATPKTVSTPTTNRKIPPTNRGPGPSVSSAEVTPAGTPSAEHKQKGRKSRAGTPKPASYRILFTKVEAPFIRMDFVEELGGHEARNIRECTHLVAQKIARTQKFLIFLNSMKEHHHIVHVDWLLESNKAGRFLDPANFPLVDRITEEKYQFSLEESIAHVKSNPPLLKGKRFYMTSSVTPPFETMKDIIETAGGELISKSYPKLAEDAERGRVIVFSIEDDYKECRAFIERGVRLYSTELLLTGLLRRKIELSDQEFWIHFASR